MENYKKISGYKSKNGDNSKKLKKGEKEMLEKLRAVIEEKLNAEGVEITEETSFKEDLNADSLDLFELVDRKSVV